ncbi:MAG: argininosuccinate lyase [Verrucomicrobia bacterium]|nr:argininosuccinate lyase [Verrucomicrobiota bacterium]
MAKKAKGRPRKLWGGRFTEATDALVEAFSASVDFDKRLARYDVQGSVAHAHMLGEVGLITRKEAAAIRRGLIEILEEIESGAFEFDPALEDVHMNIEARLIDRLGATGAKLHTARSRNDQVALDLRLFLRDAVGEIVAALRRLQHALVGLAEANADVIMPGYTHLQRGQLVLVAHHLLAYVEMFERDAERLLDALKRINVLPLGACAVAGTTLPIDRKLVAEALGFPMIAANSIDAVSDRDFVIEYLADLALIAVHLSRLGEELVLWSSSEFAFIRIGEAFCTGSSMLPQKRNPDVAELVRGHSGRVIGALVALLTTMKGLPLSYNRDMQHDKEPVFKATDVILASLEVVARMVPTIAVNREVLERALEDDSVLAVDVAEYLVRKGVPFRRAHEIVGAVVGAAERAGKKLREVTLDEWRRHERVFDKDVFGLLDAKRSLDRKTSRGSTAPNMVKREIGRWKRRLGGE